MNPEGAVSLLLGGHAAGIPTARYIVCLPHNHKPFFFSYQMPLCHTYEAVEVLGAQGRLTVLDCRAGR
jgi:hypothetical protein